MKTYTSLTIDHLTSLSESELQQKIVEPLLRAWGFTHVRDTSGPNDKGKDLIGIKYECGLTKLYAIQVKKLEVVGKHSMPNSLMHLLIQLQQIFSEPVQDPTTNIMRTPERAMFITPYAISRHAFDSALHKMKELERHEITVIDGPLLLDQVLKLIPDAVDAIDPDLRYRVNLSQDVNRVAEYQALGTSDPLLLDSIFVDVSVGERGFNLKKLCSPSFRIPPPKICAAHDDEIAELNSVATNIPDGSRPVVCDPPRHTSANSGSIEGERRSLQVRIDKLKQPMRKSNLEGSQTAAGVQTTAESPRAEQLKRLQESRIVEIDLEPTLRPLINAAAEHCRLAMSRESMASDSALNSAIKRQIVLRNAGDDLIGAQLIRRYWKELLVCISDKGEQREVFAAEDLLKIKHAVFLQGPAGAGKTTLLRRLAQEVARRGGGGLPIVLYLIKCRKFDAADGLIQICVDELARYGVGRTSDEFEKLAELGECRLFLDGLDELGPSGVDVLRGVRQFCARFPNCPVLLTSRDTVAQGLWRDAFQVHTTPFDDSRLLQFVSKWFTAEPSRRDALNRWLSQNLAMKQTARTPINAALLCSLFQAGADLPTTEVELYTRRFELLLGRWEQAKGITPLSPDRRRRYEFFLMRLAFRLHGEHNRVIEFSEAVQFAHDLSPDGLSSEAEAMIQDCVHRGLLERELTGHLTFGHLTYQEFMAAKWLCHENPLDLVWAKMEDPWWRLAVNFYASLKGDLTTLFQRRFGKKMAAGRRRRVAELLGLAKLTSLEVSRELGLA